jgi:hypothetical protein
VQHARCDVVLTIGGGSVIDAGKGSPLLLRTAASHSNFSRWSEKVRTITVPPLPFIAVPTSRLRSDLTFAPTGLTFGIGHLVVRSFLICRTSSNERKMRFVEDDVN